MKYKTIDIMELPAKNRGSRTFKSPLSKTMLNFAESGAAVAELEWKHDYRTRNVAYNSVFLWCKKHPEYNLGVTQRSGNLYLVNKKLAQIT